MPGMEQIAVVGAGPAGLMAALTAAEQDKEIQLFEKGPSAGRKLRLSGAGQCNLTHAGTIDLFLNRYGSAGRFIRPALYYLPPEKLLGFFSERGVEFVTEPSDKVFPASRRAGELLQVLTREADRRGVRTTVNNPVVNLVTREEGFQLRMGDGADRQFEKVILCCGGSSYPGTGSDGSGFQLASTAGHRIIEPRPALTDVEIEQFPFTECAGVAIPNTTVTLRRGGTRVADYTGDLLITHRGFSGPVIIDSSRSFRTGDELVPDFSGLGEKADETIVEWCQRYGKRRIRSLGSLFSAPERLFRSILRLSGIDEARPAAELRRTEREAILAVLQGRAFRIERLGGFERAMVTAGGVDRAEINPKTMESRLHAGLYFAGELIDIDGESGGFNLQAAFSSGALAGSSAAAG